MAFLDPPTISDSERGELSSVTGPSSGGGRNAVSHEMRNTPLVRGLEERLGDKLLFFPERAPAGYLEADTVSPRGFSLRTSRSNGNVWLLNISGGRPGVQFPPRSTLDKLSGKRNEVEDYARVLLRLELDISQFGPRQQPSLPLDDVLGALDQISDCVAALA